MQCFLNVELLFLSLSISQAKISWQLKIAEHIYRTQTRLFHSLGAVDIIMIALYYSKVFHVRACMNYPGNVIYIAAF